MSELINRPRRLRRTQALRELVAETTLSAQDLVMPLFVIEGENLAEPIPSMPGQSRYSVDLLTEKCAELYDLGIRGVILFGIPATKDATGSAAWDSDGIVQRAIRAIKAKTPELIVMADVCLCEYTDHGHCGVLKDNSVDNDPTLVLLAKVAVSCADAGCDIVAPSDMMDGRIGWIRAALDEAGHTEIAILSYAAKYTSAFYGPFRDAAQSAPSFGDRSGYQMQPANSNEALREVALDIEQGADMVMVKPGMPYLDIVRRVKDEFKYPTGVYQVSGEYAMIMAASERGWLDLDRAINESLMSIKRAGADFILTYFAETFAKTSLKT